ncbi:MAG: hypothetical protein JHC88_09775 [Niveispirillum sp.]|nr:hypothetical protein [Niveispirillum sp.]
MSNQRIPTNTLLAAAQSDGAVQIPLIYIPLGDSAKIGIHVAVSVPGWNNNEPVKRIYEFDTGGKGFWVDSTHLPLLEVEPLGSVETLYTSGNFYEGTAALATVSFPDATVPSGTSAPAITATVGLVTTFNRYPQGCMIQSTDPLVVVKRSNGETQTSVPDKFPIFTECYGDFGASLDATSGSPSLLSVLAQYVPTTQSSQALQSGFIVSVPTSASDKGYLILGIGSALSALFKTEVAMNPSGSPAYPLNGGGSVPTFSEQIINADVAVGTLPPLQGLGICLDTGCPKVVMHGGTTLTIGTSYPDNYGSGSLRIAVDGGTVLMDPGTDYNTMPSPTTNQGPGYINTGVQNFMAYQVMYNLSTGKLYLSGGG